MVRLDGPCHLEKLKQAVQIVVRRHEALHLQFGLDGSYQQKSDPTPIEMPLYDLSGLATVDQQQATSNIFARVGSTPFDLVNGPLFRLEIIKLSEEAHILVFSCHHIVCDGWSWNVLLQEMGTVYSGLCQGTGYELNRTFSFSNYVVAEIQRQSDQAVQKSYEYWLEQFADLPPALDLPTDRARPPFKSFAGGTVTHTFDPELYKAVKKVAAEQRVSLFALLFSTFNLMLARLSNQKDLVITVPAAGQLNVGQRELIGYCVNLLPVRMKLDMDAPFGAFVKQARDAILDAYEHQESTLSGIVKRLGVPHDPSRMPISEINFNLDRDDAGVQFDDLDVTIAQTPKEATIFDLFFNLNETSSGLKVDCDYNKTLFDRETVARWIGCYEALLAAIAADADQQLADIHMLTDADRQKILVDWNQTASPYRRDVCLHQLFEEQALRTPDKIAAIFPTGKLTYLELQTKSNQLAHYLREKGVTRETLVGIYVDRSPEMLIGILGTMIAGGAYVPLDPNYPQERLAYIVEDTRMNLLLTTTDLEDGLPENNAEIIRLNIDWIRISKYSTETPENVNSSEDTAFVVYTSGSTGKPKGVKAIHRSHVNRYQWMWETYPFADHEVCCQKTSLNFIDHSWEIYGPLFAGVSTVYLPDEVVKQPVELLNALEKHRITRLILVPGHMSSLLDSYDDLAERLPRLKYWTASGEAVTVELARQFQKQLPDRVLLNLYGMSEVGIDVTCYELEDAETLSMVPIGRPIANSKAYILDAAMQPVPVGVVGEIYAGGEILSGGYLHRPDLTDERFVPNPFADGPFAGEKGWLAEQTVSEIAKRLYRTGDLGRYREDGMIEYIGRADHQVKIRGFRVELGEIEANLLSHPGVQQCVVMDRKDPSGVTQLVGYVLSSDTGEHLGQEDQVTEQELKAYLRQTLPDYMIPTHLAVLSKFPLTPNGKVNRIVLQEVKFTASEEQIYVAPRTSAEKRLAEMWTSLLEVERVGVQDSFFDLGGHSLLAVRLFAQIRDEFGENLPLSVLFDAPTIEGLAQRLQGAYQPPSSEDEVTKESVESKTDSPTDNSVPKGWSPLVLINEGTPDRTPFFCVHGGGGNVLNFRELAGHLDEAVPFYGLQARGVDGISQPHKSIEEMAACYLEAIQEVSPEGPYVVGGYSGGGIVAYEIAQRLLAMGHEVHRLVLLDTFRPDTEERAVSVRSRVKSLRNQGAGYITERLKDRAESKRIEQERREIVEKAITKEIEIPIEVRDWYLTTNFFKAVEKYTPTNYKEAAILLSAEEIWPIYAHVGIDRGWRTFVPDLEIKTVPGDHNTLMEGANAKAIANHLNQILNI